MSTVTLPQREVRVLDNVDVCVIGGGPGGLPAALAAARLGAKTLLVEMQGFLGGMATAGLIGPILGHRASGGGDAVIGVNPATDNVDAVRRVLEMLDTVRDRFAIPTQSCVLSHVTTTMLAMDRGAPVDLVFQSIGGTQGANASFGVSLAVLREAREQALALKRGTVGDNVALGGARGIAEALLDAGAHLVVTDLGDLVPR